MFFFGLCKVEGGNLKDTLPQRGVDMQAFWLANAHHVSHVEGLMQTPILEGLEVFNTNLLALCQPLPPVARKTTTLAVNLHKGIKVCTRTSFESK